MKIAIDKYKKIKDNDYCVRVTSDEGDLGRDYLEAFQNNDRDIPAILTSSKMLTTGVDAKNVRNVILTAPIRSMTEFKQIIGRGTRIYEGKDFFTIIDFVGATNLFYDKAWDGLPEEQIADSAEDRDFIKDPGHPYAKKSKRQNKDDKTGERKKEKVIIDIKGRKLKVIDIETTYVGEDGRPLRTDEYLELLIGILGKFYNDEAKLREIWSNPKNRRELLEKLREMNIDEAQLYDLKSIFEAHNSDIYDVLAHISFNLEIMTRSERVLAVENSEFVESYHDEKARDFIEFILERYNKDGVKELDEDKLSSLIKLSGIDREVLKEAFGSVGEIKEGYFGLQREIYR
jgi:type I restriction enzyme R subunit